MRFTSSILTSLLEPIDRRRFKAIVDRHGGDAYGKSFNSWEHLVALVLRNWRAGDSKLPIFLRRITVRRDNGDVFDILANDPHRSPVELAACYKSRWQIELFFKWVKQNLNIAKFIAFNENAVRLQIFAAMPAYALLHIARQKTRTALSLRRFVELAGAFIHDRRPIAAIGKPPPINKTASRLKTSTQQIEMAYCMNFPGQQCRAREKEKDPNHD
jgi:hypothetical protein